MNDIELKAKLIKEDGCKKSTAEYLVKIWGLCHRLIGLIEDAHPGLSTWCIFYGNTFDELSKLWTEGNKKEESNGEKRKR